MIALYLPYLPYDPGTLVRNLARRLTSALTAFTRVNRSPKIRSSVGALPSLRRSSASHLGKTSPTAHASTSHMRVLPNLYRQRMTCERYAILLEWTDLEASATDVRHLPK
nr:hypothetical protein CFP56_33435 [Quercus suber]